MIYLLILLGMSLSGLIILGMIYLKHTGQIKQKESRFGVDHLEKCTKFPLYLVVQDDSRKTGQISSWAEDLYSCLLPQCVFTYCPSVLATKIVVKQNA